MAPVYALLIAKYNQLKYFSRLLEEGGGERERERERGREREMYPLQSSESALSA